MTKAKILIVEDEVIVSKDLESKLNKLGYDVAGSASTGKDAVAKTKIINPDIILMDIALKGSMNGIEASKTIREHHDIPIIYLTASSDELTIQKAEKGNPFGYIIKPYGEKELQTNIEIALSRYQLEKRLKESEGWLTATFDSMGDAVIAADKNGIIRKMNAQAEDLTGWKKDAAIGKKITEVFQTRDEKTGEDLTKSLLKGIEDSASEKLINTEILISRSGSTIYIDKRAAPIKTGDGNILGVVMIFRDVTEKRRLQQQIFDSEKKFRHIFEQANDAIFLMEKGIFRDCNAKAEKIVGRKKEMIINKKLGDLFDFMQLEYPQDPPAKIYEEIKKDLQKGNVTREFILKRKDGKEIIAEVSFSSIVIDNKLMELIFIHDISDRKKLEKAFQESEKQYRQLVEMAQEGIWSINANYDTVFVNPRMAEITGFTVLEMIGSHFCSFFHPEDSKKCINNIEKAKKNMEKSFEERLIRKDKSLIYVRITVSPILNETGALSGHIFVVTDITNLKKEEEEIRKLSSAIEQSPSSIVITDIKGNIEYVNPHFIELTGYSKDELLGNNPRVLKTDYTPREEYVKLWKIISEGGTWQGVFHNKKKNGELYWELASISPIKNSGGTITHYIGVKENITDRKKAEDALSKTLMELARLNENLDKKVKDELNKNREKDQLLIQQSRQAAMGEMIGNIAHQWRQPINALGIVIQNIEQSFVHEKLTKKYLENTVNKAMSIIRHMSQTIDDFRNFFKPDKEKEDFSIKEAVNKTISFMETSLREYNILIIFKTEKDIIRNGFPNEYCQVIMNIFSNVKDAVLERKIHQSNIVIELTENNGKSILTIRDNAGGIPENIIDRVFDPYFSTKEHGSGIGLYMSKVIIEKNMGGKLTAGNIGKKPDSTGAEFKIEL